MRGRRRLTSSPVRGAPARLLAIVAALLCAWLSISALPASASGANSGRLCTADAAAGTPSSASGSADAGAEASRRVATPAVENAHANNGISAPHRRVVDTHPAADLLAEITANPGRASSVGLADASTTVGLHFVAPSPARFCSFSAETEVLMADGTTKPISAIEVGDWVLAEDPETGERGAREVTHLWVHQDTIIDLEIDGHDVATTEDHPFWNATDSEWQRADALDPGDPVLTAEGATLTVDGIDWGSARATTAYNLTVDDIHTYHVQVGDEEVLVHNVCLPRFNGPKPTYHVNPAHVPGQGLMRGKTPLPSDAEDVFRTAIPNDPQNPTAWFGRNSDGQIYRYSLGNDGSAHLSGIDGVRNLTPYAVERLNALGG